MDGGAWWLQSMGSQRVEQDWSTNTLTFLFCLPGFILLCYTNLHACIWILVSAQQSPSSSPQWPSLFFSGFLRGGFHGLPSDVSWAAPWSCLSDGEWWWVGGWWVGTEEGKEEFPFWILKHCLITAHIQVFLIHVWSLSLSSRRDLTVFQIMADRPWRGATTGPFEEESGACGREACERWALWPAPCWSGRAWRPGSSSTFLTGCPPWWSWPGAGQLAPSLWMASMCGQPSGIAPLSLPLWGQKLQKHLDWTEKDCFYVKIIS